MSDYPITPSTNGTHTPNALASTLDGPLAAPRPSSTFSRATVPWPHILTSLLFIGPIPFTKIITVLALVAEANRHHSSTRSSDRLTDLEASVRAPVETRAQRRLDRQVGGPVEKLVAAIKPLHALVKVIDEQLSFLPSTPIIGNTGEQLSPVEAEELHDDLREQIASATRQNFKKHLINRRRRVKEIGLLMLDFPVFLFALIGILNVNLRLVGTETTMTIRLAIAATFALLGTLLLAVVMRTMGRRHRDHKGPSSSIEADPQTKPRIRLELGGLIAVVAAAALVMGTRIYLEGHNAQAPQVMVIALASMFALLIAFSAYLNYTAEYDHGSAQTDQLQHLAFQLQYRANLTNQLTNARSVTLQDAHLKTDKLIRLTTKARTDAEHRVTGSHNDKAIRIARSYHGHNGTHSQLPALALDYTALALAAAQAVELNTTQHHLENAAHTGPTTTANNLDVTL